MNGPSVREPVSATVDKVPEIGPFGCAAMDLYRLGLMPLPCPSDDGKSVKGAVRGYGKWRRRAPLSWITKMMERWPTANVGIHTRLSNVTVVDVDDPALIDAMIVRFGETPLKTRTPSGGMHLWYRRSDDADHNLRKTEGLPVDVRSNGIIVVPPSIRPCGKHAGRGYEFVEGSWDDLARLPEVQAGSLAANRVSPSEPARLRAVSEGWRNDTLFRLLLRHARQCDDKIALQDVGDTINDNFDPPLPLSEVTKTVESAWNYEVTGRNWAGIEAKVQLTSSMIEVLTSHKSGPDATVLYLKLRLANSSRPNFAASSKAMARGQVIPGWAHGRYRNALYALSEIGLLTVIHEGGQGTGDPRLFSFATPITTKGPGK
jgi:hypothetical protein